MLQGEGGGVRYTQCWCIVLELPVGALLVTAIEQVDFREGVPISKHWWRRPPPTLATRLPSRPTTRPSWPAWREVRVRTSSSTIVGHKNAVVETGRPFCPPLPTWPYLQPLWPHSLASVSGCSIRPWTTTSPSCKQPLLSSEPIRDWDIDPCCRYLNSNSQRPKVTKLENYEIFLLKP